MSINHRFSIKYPRISECLMLCILGLAIPQFSCTSDEDQYLYEVEQFDLVPPSGNQDKAKTTNQYISILYADVFEKALAANDQVEIGNAMFSIGDQELARQVVISNFLNHPEAQVPSRKVMLEDLDQFVIDTYRKFFIRDPSQAELAYVKSFIEADPNVSPEVVYLTFATSNEYQYY
ncbi:MAG: hypothetical protein AAGI38_01100 [Bacteroidota bacterium]